MLGYFIFGLLWSLFLEIYSTTQLEKEYSQNWSMIERAFHIGLWPYSFSVFLYTLIKEYIHNQNKDE